MKPIGAGRIGGLVVRVRGLVRIKPLGTGSVCVRVCACVCVRVRVCVFMEKRW